MIPQFPPQTTALKDYYDQRLVQFGPPFALTTKPFTPSNQVPSLPNQALAGLHNWPQRSQRHSSLFDDETPSIRTISCSFFFSVNEPHTSSLASTPLKSTLGESGKIFNSDQPSSKTFAALERISRLTKNYFITTAMKFTHFNQQDASRKH